MKVYNTEKSLKNWVIEHRLALYSDILDACEENLVDEDKHVLIATIHTTHGVTVFSLPGVDDVLSSLKKCEDIFIQLEEYEKAARARDCYNEWFNKKIYKEKP